MSESSPVRHLSLVRNIGNGQEITVSAPKHQRQVLTRFGKEHGGYKKLTAILTAIAIATGAGAIILAAALGDLAIGINPKNTLLTEWVALGLLIGTAFLFVYLRVRHAIFVFVGISTVLLLGVLLLGVIDRGLNQFPIPW